MILWIRTAVRIYLSRCTAVRLNKRSYGDYSSGVHLFPFRTESLSPLAQMVLQFLWESMSSPIFFKPSLTAGFFFALFPPATAFFRNFILK